MGHRQYPLARTNRNLIRRITMSGKFQFPNHISNVRDLKAFLNQFEAATGIKIDEYKYLTGAPKETRDEKVQVWHKALNKMKIDGASYRITTERGFLNWLIHFCSQHSVEIGFGTLPDDAFKKREHEEEQQPEPKPGSTEKNGLLRHLRDE